MGEEKKQVRDSGAAPPRASAPDSKRGPALLPAPVSPDFGVSIPKDQVAWFRRHAPPAPARACGLCVGHRDRGLRSRGSFRHRSTAARFETAGGGNEALLDTGSSRSLASTERLRTRFHPWPQHRLHDTSARSIRSAFARPSARRLRHRLRDPFGWAASATACAAPSASRSAPGYPRSDFLGLPEGILILPDRVSSSLCSGFPRRRFLLTVVRLSPIRDSGKGELGRPAC